MVTIMGKVEFTAKPEFRIVRALDPLTSPVYAWGEVLKYLLAPLFNLLFKDKRLQLPTLKSFPSTVAQKVAEGIATAMNNRGASKTQEVFGIGVRHTYFSFWHAGLYQNVHS